MIRLVTALETPGKVSCGLIPRREKRERQSDGDAVTPCRGYGTTSVSLTRRQPTG